MVEKLNSLVVRWVFDVAECIVYMFRALTYNLFFPVLFLFDWVGGGGGVMAPII